MKQNKQLCLTLLAIVSISQGISLNQMDTQQQLAQVMAAQEETETETTTTANNDSDEPQTLEETGVEGESGKYAFKNKFTPNDRETDISNKFKDNTKDQPAKYDIKDSKDVTPIKKVTIDDKVDYKDSFDKQLDADLVDQFQDFKDGEDFDNDQFEKYDEFNFGEDKVECYDEPTPYKGEKNYDYSKDDGKKSYVKEDKKNDKVKQYADKVEPEDYDCTCDEKTVKTDYNTKDRKPIYDYKNDYYQDGDNKYKGDRDYKYTKEPVKCEICSSDGHVNEFCITDLYACEETVEFLADRIVEQEEYTAFHENENTHTNDSGDSFKNYSFIYDGDITYTDTQHSGKDSCGSGYNDGISFSNGFCCQQLQDNKVPGSCSHCQKKY